MGGGRRIEKMGERGGENRLHGGGGAGEGR